MKSVFSVKVEGGSFAAKDESLQIKYIDGHVWMVADGMTGVSFRSLPALLCLY